MKYLLDTNVLSEPTRRSPDDSVMDRLRRHEAHVCTAAVVLHELLYGLERLHPGKRRSRLTDYVRVLRESRLVILPYGEKEAAWHATARAVLDSRGLSAPFVDGQIAATAGANDLVLVTRNTADFRPYAGLRVENWFES